MTQHRIATKEQWLQERLKLLEAEKELTRKNDELTQLRMQLPWVKVDENYRFETEEGSLFLKDLFKGRSQLIIYHFMFGPDFKSGCPSCSAIADGFNGIVSHLENHDVMFWAVSRAPLKKLQEYKLRMAWSFPWASSIYSKFNYDFTVSITEFNQAQGSVNYNYNKETSSNIGQEWKDAKKSVLTMANMSGTDILSYTRERPGMSSFVLDNDIVYHSYSTYARGLDCLWNMYQWLDRAPKGRNENDGIWWKRHDEYFS